MSSQTTNLHLVKPADGETADIGVINSNMDTIDSAVGTLQQSVSNVKSTNASGTEESISAGTRTGIRSISPPSGVTMGSVVSASVSSGSTNVVPFNVGIGTSGVTFNLYNVASSAQTVTPTATFRYIEL